MTQPSVSLLRHAASLDTANLCSISSPQCRLSFVYPWSAVHQQPAAERRNQAEPKLWDLTFWARAEFRIPPPSLSYIGLSPHRLLYPLFCYTLLGTRKLLASCDGLRSCGAPNSLLPDSGLGSAHDYWTPLSHFHPGLIPGRTIVVRSYLELSSRRTEPLDILFEPYPQTTPPYARDESRSGSLSGRGSGNRTSPCFMFVWDRHFEL